MPVFRPEELRQLGCAIYERMGASASEAKTVADLLVDANLAGHDSHGVVRIPQYVSAIKRGQIKLGTSPEVEQQTAAMGIGVLDMSQPRPLCSWPLKKPVMLRWVL